MRILEVATSLEEAELVPIDALRLRYGWSDRDHRIFTRLFGLRSACLHDGLSLKECLGLSLAKLMSRNAAMFGRIDGLIYCHALNDPMPFDQPILDDLARRFLGGCPDVMSVTHSACASSISILEYLSSVAQSLPDKRYFVILTGEKCFDAVLQYAAQSGLFGEASTAVLVDVHATSRAGIKFVSSAHGRIAGVYDPVVKLDLAMRNYYDEAYIPTIVSVVRSALMRGGIEVGQLSAFLPTHLSPFTFDKVATQLGIPRIRIVKDNLYTLGHCFCGDAFINLHAWLKGSRGGHGDQYAMTFAAGMTGTFAAMILKKEIDDD